MLPLYPAQNEQGFLLENGLNPLFPVESQRPAGYNLRREFRTKKLTAQPSTPSGRLPPQTLKKSSWAQSILIIPTITSNHRKAASVSSEVAIDGAILRTGELAEVLDAPHEHGGNPGFPASAMLRAFFMQFALNERYANGFLNRLGCDERLLGICGLEYAPSEGAYSRFKKKLVPYEDYIWLIVADVFLECGDEIERLREAGVVPADKPPLGHSLVVDSTDIEAWARPSRKSRKTGEEIPCKDPDAKWGHRTAKNSRSKSSSGKRRGSKKGKADGKESGQKESKDELYLGYKVDVITDANHGLPMFARTRPANASDVTVDDRGHRRLPSPVPRVEPELLPGRQGLRQPQEHPARH